jgi:hypothetical protein
MALAMLIVVAVPAIRRRREDAFYKEREELQHK